MQITIVLVFLHANIARYVYFLVTKGNLTLLFFSREKIQLELTNRHHLIPRDVCYLEFQMVTQYFCLYLSVNSIRALKLSAIVPRILNKREAFISGRFLGLCSSSLFIFDEHFL